MTWLSPTDAPVAIAHRGASGYRPEHTRSAYRLAIELGADAVEPDLVATRDGVLVLRHENEIGGTTDVAAHPEFAGRRVVKVVDGALLEGWFTEDFTLAELKTLRATERLPDLRPGNAEYDGLDDVMTLDELLLLVAEESARAGRDIGVCIEIKHSTYFSDLGLPLEPALLETLRDHGLDHRGSGVMIESFETANLRWLRSRTEVPLVQLVEGWGAPPDLVAAGRSTTYADLTTPEGLRTIGGYADGVSLRKELVLPRDATGALCGVSDVVSRAHAAGLLVLVFTLRDENQFLATDFHRGEHPAAPGDSAAELRMLLDAGVDAVFSDQTTSAVRACRAWLPARVS